MAQGKLVVEGATVQCNQGTTPTSPVTVKHANDSRYTVNGKKLMTWLEDDIQHYNFGSCRPKNNAACSPNVKWTDYYNNADFHGVNPLLDCSRGTCSVGGGTITITNHGQRGTPSNTIAANVNRDTYDIVMVTNTPVANQGQNCSVQSIQLITPTPAAAKSTVNVELGKRQMLNFTAHVSNGSNPALVNWVIFHGKGATDRNRTWVHKGPAFNLHADSLPKGEYRVEAYGRSPGDQNCSIYLNVTENKLKEITCTPTAANGLTKRTPYQFTAQYYFATQNNNNNPFGNLFGFGTSLGNVFWEISQGNNILYNSSGITSNTIQVVKNASNQISVVFNNDGNYKIKAYDIAAFRVGATEVKEMSVRVRARSINSISKENGTQDLMRVSQSIHLKAGNISYDYYSPGFAGKAYWYVKNNNVVKLYQVGTTNSFKDLTTNAQSLAQLFGHSDLYQTYHFEAYGELQSGGNLAFSGSDSASIQFSKNQLASIEGPKQVPLGGKITYTVKSKMALTSGESVTLQFSTPSGMQEIPVTGETVQLEFKEKGKYILNGQLRGLDADPKPLDTPLEINAEEAVLEEALWCFASGKKRTESSWDEDSHCSVTLKGLAKQSLEFYVWVLKEGVSLEETLADTEKYQLAQLSATTNDDGVAQVKFTTDETAKQKIEPLLSSPDSTIQILFTVVLSGSDSSNLSGIQIQKKNGGTVNSMEVAHKNHVLVLEPTDYLKVPAAPGLNGIEFTNEAGNEVQFKPSTYTKNHKIQVHTIGMVKEKLIVKVYRKLSSREMEESYNAEEKLYAIAKEVKSFPAEEVGQDSTLQLDFTVDEAWKEEAPELPQKYFFAAVFKEQKKEDDTTELIQIKSQHEKVPSALHNVQWNDDLTELRIGIPNLEEGQTPNGSQLQSEANKTWQTVGHLVVLPTDMEEVEEGNQIVEVRGENVMHTKTCYCDRPFTLEEVKDLVKTMTGKEEIWAGITQACDITDKTFESLTREINLMLGAYGINKCIQKIAFLANLKEETGFFRQSKEETSSHLSSQSTYKGRGILQITGEKDSTGYYNNPGPYRTYGAKIGKETEVVNTPDLLSEDLHYAVDVGGWVWDVFKKRPGWKHRSKRSNETEASYNETMTALQWKREYFDKAKEGDSLNDIALLMADEEEKYFYLTAKLLNGYGPKHTNNVDPIGWAGRKSALTKLKTWFKYDKNVCKGQAPLQMGDMPPWMKIALEEYAAYDGKHNGQSPLNERIHEYFDNTVYTTGTNKDNWCAAFVTWCLNKSTPSYTAPTSYGAVRARAFTPQGRYQADHHWEAGTETKNGEPAYGATVMITWDGGGDHVAFVIGKTSTGRIAVLGGNQSIRENGVKVGSGITKSSCKLSEIKAFMYPTDYTAPDAYYNLSSEDITDVLTSADTHL